MVDLISEDKQVVPSIFLQKGKDHKFVLPNYDFTKSSFESWFNDSSLPYDSNVAESPIYENFRLKLFNHLDKLEKLSPAIDFGCGTGISGQELIDLGVLVDGIDFAETHDVVLKNGYSNFYASNLATDSLSLSHKYAVAISIGLIGDYVPGEIVLPKMIEACDENALIGFTSLKENTFKKNIKNILKNSGFKTLEFDLASGYSGKGVMNDQYYFVFAKR